MLALSVETDGNAGDRREPRFLNGTLALPTEVTVPPAVENEWRLFVTVLLLLPIFVGFTPLNCLKELIFLSEYANKSHYTTKFQKNADDQY